ncbi:MAG: hypothetical protein HC809_08750 [Gammaproteobacteria bacterium]|nr:hypothetical protein [Gammaproteobacteria bacterium]
MPDFESAFRPVLDEIERRAAVAGSFVDKDLYRIYIATLWANMVMDPAEAGLAETDLEPLHDYLNGAIARILGAEHTLTDCFRFLNTKAGELAMDRSRMTSTHRDLLTYFCSMILDPEGHRKWAQDIASQ